MFQKATGFPVFKIKHTINYSIFVFGDNYELNTCKEVLYKFLPEFSNYFLLFSCRVIEGTKMSTVQTENQQENKVKEQKQYKQTPKQ